MEIAAALDQRIDPFAGGPDRWRRAFTARLGRIVMLTEFVFDGGAGLDRFDETPDAFMIARLGQSLAPEHRRAKPGPSFRLHHHVKALDVGQAFGTVFVDPRPVGKIDVALFDDLLRNLSLRAAAPSSHRNHIAANRDLSCTQQNAHARVPEFRLAIPRKRPVKLREC